MHGEQIEGSFHSHQVPLAAAKSDPQELRALQEWLSDYKPKELFPEDGGVTDSIMSIIPMNDDKKLGQRKETYDMYLPLEIPDWQKFGVKKGGQESCMKACGRLLDQVLVDNPKTFRIFSPDELVSNKLDGVFKHTQRNFQWDEACFGKGGRVIEMLSEHTLQGFLQVSISFNHLWTHG